MRAGVQSGGGQYIMTMKVVAKPESARQMVRACTLVAQCCCLLPGLPGWFALTHACCRLPVMVLFSAPRVLAAR